MASLLWANMKATIIQLTTFTTKVCSGASLTTSNGMGRAAEDDTGWRCWTRGNDVHRRSKPARRRLEKCPCLHYRKVLGLKLLVVWGVCSSEGGRVTFHLQANPSQPMFCWVEHTLNLCIRVYILKVCNTAVPLTISSNDHFTKGEWTNDWILYKTISCVYTKDQYYCHFTCIYK